MRFIINLLVTGLIVAAACYLISGAHVENFWWAIITGLVIGFVNSVVGGILRLFTFPLNWLTFGLVSFIITVLMIMLSDKIMGSKFDIDGFWTAVWFAIVVAIFEMIVGRVVTKDDK
ncbi:phage holin family protein [Sphingobacterium hungaricum]|uniref:Phage holin family protein n=1 Tax=Sphingobacterium hungaricum TaxID=2082723 RepID=A0A928V061_9SPHI|nr:phage holin family protein [Sphingobacterium hungaricum]MBE8714047.1 phage holin family protein [Sphingobacterium hungaricum]